jgi:hypothetical protein
MTGDQMREYYLQCFKEGLSLFVHILNLRIWQGTPAEPAAHWQTRTRTRLSAIRLGVAGRAELRNLERRLPGRSSDMTTWDGNSRTSNSS